MKTIARLAAVLAASLATLTGVLGLTTQAAHAATACAPGYVCLYRGTTTASGIQTQWYTYGAHNLSNVYNNHLIVNNQTGGATYRLCTAYDGGGCGSVHAPGSLVTNLTPINSVTLQPKASTPPPSGAVGGTITRSQVAARLQNWYSRRPAYSQSTYIWDLGSTRKYRTDCSGLADMALHLNADDNTTGIANDTSRFARRYNLGNATVRSQLIHSSLATNRARITTGDVFDDTIDGHAFVFAGWNSDGSFNYYNFGGGASGYAPPEYHTHAHFSDSSLGYETTTHYVVYRYRKLVV